MRRTRAEERIMETQGDVTLKVPKGVELLMDTDELRERVEHMRRNVPGAAAKGTEANTELRRLVAELARRELPALSGVAA